MAERVGFEPTVEFPLHTLSKRAPSTARTSLRTRPEEQPQAVYHAGVFSLSVVRPVQGGA